MAFPPKVVGPDGPSVLPDTGGPLRVCIVLLSGVGDVVHGLPLALDLKALGRPTEVTWVAEPVPAQILSHHPAVDRLVVYRSRAGIRGLAELRRAMAGYSADVTLNIQRYLKSAWPTLLSGASIRVGLPPSKTRDGIRWIHTHTVAETPWKHTQDLFLDFRGALGVPRADPVRWSITFSPEERAAQRAFVDDLRAPGPIASLVVATANPKKDWPAERYARLAEALSDDHGFTVLLVGGPSAREARMARSIAEGARTSVVDLTADSLRRLMWLLDASDLVVAPDTGPLHIAHALDVPVVGLFGHTNPWRVGPWTRFKDLVVDGYTEAGIPPDPSAYAPRERGMDRVTVDAVREKVDLAVKRYVDHPRAPTRTP